MGWIGCVRCVKIPMGLDGTRFFTSLTHFTLSVVTQPNSPKCTQIKRNTPKHEITVRWAGSGVFVSKIPMRLCGTNFGTSSAHFPSSFACQPNGPNCTKIVWNAQKFEFWVQWGGSGAFVAKSSNASSWHELLHPFFPFSIKFCEPTKWSQLH